MMSRLVGRTILAFLLMYAAGAALAQLPIRVEASTRQSDGKIIYGGRVDGGPTLLIERLNPNGTRDPSFYGRVDPPDASWHVTAMTVLSDGRIVLAARSDTQVAIIRLDNTGGLDLTFGTPAAPGMVIDAQSAGLAINALAADPTGGVLGFGSFTGTATGGVANMSMVRYGADGTRDTGFAGTTDGVQMYGVGESEIRAVVETSGAFAFIARLGPPGSTISVGRLLANGQVDPSFPMTSVATGDPGGIGTDGAGNVVALGATFDGFNPGKGFLAVRLRPDGSVLDNLSQRVDVPGEPLVYATAMSVAPINTGELLLAGTAIGLYSGRTYFAFARTLPGGPAPSPATAVGPADPSYDDLLVAAYASGDQFVAIGTREPYDVARRARYFSDNLEFDTDFMQEGFDTTPNPFAFPPVGGAALSEVRTSQSVRISGIDQPTPVSIQGGSYSIGCAEPFTTADSSILNGQRVCVRVTSASTPATDTSAVLTIGSVQGTFTVTTVGPPETTIVSAPPSPSGQSVAFYYSGDTVSGPITGFECRVDADPFNACPFNPPNSHVGLFLQPGTHTFQVRASNAYGTDPTPASYTWTVMPPPTVSLTSVPSSLTNQTSATLAFSADQSVTFQCKHDFEQSFATCASPKTYTGLAQGSHTFSVQGYNAFGLSNTATYSWTIDSIAPDTRITQWPGSPTSSTTANFAYTSVGETTSLFQCSLDGGAWYACDGGYTTVTVTAGSHSMSIRAVDAAGNVDPTPASQSWVVDQTPPDTTITSGPSGTVTVRTVTFFYTSTKPNSTFECAITGPYYPGGWSSCEQGGHTFYNLPDGSYTFQIRARDAAGNVDPTPDSRAWIVSAPAPDTFITSGPSGSVSSTFAAFGLSSDQSGVSFECSLDAGPWGPCPFQYSGLAQGTHTFMARAYIGSDVDDTPAQRTWTVDTIAPDTTITAKPSNYSSSTTVTFAFTSNEAGVQFQCALDGDFFNPPWVACSSPVTYQGLQSGVTHTFRVRAVDAAANADDTPALYQWTIDPASLDTTITSGPSGSIAQDSASFAFTSPDADATFECSLDSAAYAACSSPLTLTGLAQGSHSLQVRARNAMGSVDASPAVRIWTVDTIAPETTITQHPFAITQSTNADFSIAANEAATFECRLDGAAWGTCYSNQSYFNLPQGSHTFEARAIDLTGNADATPAAFTWTVDLTYGPDTAITSGPSGTVSSTSATITFNSPAGTPAVAFRCAFAGTQFDCTSPWSVSGLADGDYSFNVYAIDAEGNIDRTPAAIYWTVDTSAPDTTIVSAPSGTVAVDSASFTFSASETGASFQCSLDGAAFTACASGIAYSGLADGMHMFEVRAVDAAGNVDATPASATWSIDRTSPNTTISSGPAAVTAQTAATFVFTSTESGTFQCSLDGAAYSACSSPQSYAALAAGSHSFSVYAVDAVGNADPSPATWSWLIDVTAPETTITSAPSATVASASASIAFSSDDPAATFECALDAAAFAACASPVALSGLTDGAHTFKVRARDAAGNVDATPAMASWTVDTTPPDTSITASPASITNSTSASFSFASTEVSSTFECKLDAGAFAACASAKTYSALAAGSHTFSVRAKDAAGNVDASPASFTWTIDTTAPDTTITAGPSGNNNTSTATFSFTSTESGSTFQCKLDAGSFAACSSPTTYSGLAKGSHTFQVRAIDAAGNVDATPATRTWSVK